MSAELVVFAVVGAVSLGSAVSVVLLRNAVHAALMLVVNFFTIAVFYAVLEAQFLAAVQIIVYAGAIMVLFLFVIMLLGVDRPSERRGPQRVALQRPAAVVCGLALFVALGAGVAGPYLSSASGCPPAGAEPATRGPTACRGLASANEAGNVQGIGRLLFGPYVWPFEVMSVLLVIAALGAMVLGRKDERPEELVDRHEAPAAPPDTPPGAEESGPEEPVGAIADAGPPRAGEER